MSWTDAYIGIPHAEKGCTLENVCCWGLIRLVYKRELGIDLPGYEDRYTDEAEQSEIAKLFSYEEKRDVWALVTEPRDFDVMVYRQGRFATHAGLVAGRGMMLHVKADDQSKLEPFSSHIWQSRLAGMYRHSEVLLGTLTEAMK